MIQILYDAYNDVFSALGDLLLPKQRVDQAGLANIGVAEGADSQHFPLLILRNYRLYVHVVWAKGANSEHFPLCKNFRYFEV